MSQEPKISVIVPVYGVEKYIERCAISLFEQTLDDIEYIFVNDCTPDCSIEILKDVLDRYPNRVSQVRILNMPRNSGQAAVRKFGVENAIGEYIIHCDSDDWLKLDMYETLYTVAKETNCDIVICDYFKFYEKGPTIHVIQQVLEDKNNLIRGLLNEKVHSSLCNKLVKRDLYTNIIYPKDNLREDLTIVVQLVHFAKIIKYIPIPSYYYRQNNQSLTSFNNDIIRWEKKAYQSINNYNLLENFLFQQNKLNCYHSEMFNMRCRLKIYSFVFLLTNEGQKKWDLLFPDLNIFNILFSNLSFKSKIGYCIAKLHLYPIYRNVINKLK